MKELPLSFDPKIFFFSIINFGILFFILKKVLFAPMYNTLEERKDKIKEGLGQVEQAAKDIEGANTEKDKIISEANKKSEEIVQEAEKMKKEIINKANEEADKIIKLSREDIEREREDLRKEMNVLLFDLVTSATDRALSNIKMQEGQGKIIEKSILQNLRNFSSDLDERER